MTMREMIRTEILKEFISMMAMELHKHKHLELKNKQTDEDLESIKNIKKL